MNSNVRPTKQAIVVKAQQSDFLNYEVWLLTFGGGFQRSGIYADGVTDKNKSEFRDSIRNKITLHVNNKYKNTSVTSEDHIGNLIEIKNWINANHSNVLANGNIKLGVVQKLLNLYLRNL